ncbi:FliM/FliN family flagellar motor switch protein [Tropicimonas sediminicola]|uniref:Flagellar motor switch protein FliN/FliY n=1 Tax=Tropicimonas sediminicola TaxID=1031541 RepID=A0A239JE07_9RHOB|nr:FliM/FliN family flagellar motor switch protein [Tropicimonas sediminicola]SNT03658.1 flagellar motor switch protein FliN/FliY [Tropicimonas sediminicola]
MPDPDQSPQRSTPFSQVPVEIVVSVGRARPRISELLGLERHAVLTLDKRVEDPVELFVGDRLIARGQLIEQTGDKEGQLAVRLTEICETSEALER